MLISFELTMPNKGSWNGKWTGENKRYFIVRKISNNEHLSQLKDAAKNYHYRWDDGWSANVKAEIIDSKEAAKRRKLSAGFCGYEWMVDSIIENGEIKVNEPAF